MDISQEPKSPLRELYRKEYVKAFEDLPQTRVSRLVPFFNLKKTDKVADFACGNGMLLQSILGQFDEYVGIDFSDEFIEVLNKKIENWGLKNAKGIAGDINVVANEFPNFFDKVFTLDFSEHIFDEEFIRIYSAIRSTLKPNGTLYLHTPNATYFLERFKDLGILKQLPEHVAVRNSEQNLFLLQKIGFKNIKVNFLPHYLHGLSKLHFLSRLPLVGRYFQARLLISCSK